MVSTSQFANRLAEKYHRAVPIWAVRRVLDQLEESGVNVPRIGLARVIDDGLGDRVEAEMRRRKLVG